MKKSIKLSKTKIVICLLIIAAIGFGIYNLMWFRYIETTFTPFLENEKLIAMEKEVILNPEGREIHTY